VADGDAHDFKMRAEEEVFDADEVAGGVGLAEDAEVLLVEGIVEAEVGAVDLDVNRVVHGEAGGGEGFFYGDEDGSGFFGGVGGGFLAGEFEAGAEGAVGEGEFGRGFPMLRRRLAGVVLPCVLSLLSISTPLIAQTASTGAVRGTLTDSTGAALPGAHVKIVVLATGEERVADSAAMGVLWCRYCRRERCGWRLARMALRPRPSTV
jgi:hypothetical protein